ncbi:unnamed protein product [Cuscuta epithymum]|uniref:Uncharacterized protein n=1 Tax=Cuscuta epithymum TaxID=186058 RepID=A0AAV0ELN8_9ASTE|nr:unnamed protein product [Cuscuta epithymum]
MKGVNEWENEVKMHKMHIHNAYYITLFLSLFSSNLFHQIYFFYFYSNLVIGHKCMLYGEFVLICGYFRLSLHEYFLLRAIAQQMVLVRVHVSEEFNAYKGVNIILCT